MRPGLSFSHVGLYVRELAAMTRFYTELLEFTITDSGQLSGPHGPVELVF
ncbi:VOC family protein, partial [Escherichia coli]